MSASRREGSTLGLLDIEQLCDDFDSVLFADKLDETTSALAKRQESFHRSLRLSYPSPPKISDLHGNEQKDVSESSSRSTSSLSVSSGNTTAFQAMDSKYFREGSIFDPTSLRYSDSVIVSVGNQSELPEVPVSQNTSLPFSDFSFVPSSKLDFGKTMNLPVETLKSDKIVFLPQEIGARSTSVLESEKPKITSTKPDVSWNNSGFDVSFGKENVESHFSKASEQDFLSGRDALLALDEDEKKYEEINALEISNDHDFGNTSGLFPDLEKSAAELSLTASKIFGHQSWMAGSGKGRPSFGMTLKSPVRQINSTMQSVNFDINFTEPFEGIAEKYQTSYSVPKQKSERKGSGTRRLTLVELRKSVCQQETSHNPQIDEGNSSHSANLQTSNNSDSGLALSSTKSDTASPSASSARSLQESPLPSESSSLQVSQNPCSTSTTPNVVAFPNYEMVLPARTHLVAPFNWNHMPMDVALNSHQAGFQGSTNFQCNQVSTLNICLPELPSQVVCLGERLEVPLPIENPLPQSLQCQVVLAKVFGNQGLLSSASTEQLVSLSHSGDVLLPNERKDSLITFLARVPGQLCMTLEVQWTTVICPTIPSKMGKSTCIFNCDVVLPKVSIMSKSVTVKYHSFSNTAGTSSFALLNHTHAPVTVGLQILLSGDEDHMWPDAEFFFVLEHVRQMPGNSAHLWLNTTSPSTLSLCMAAGSAEMPSRANIPVSFKGGQLPSLPKERSLAGLGATVVVSTQNSQPARRLAAIRISVSPSQVPVSVTSQLHSTDTVVDSISSSSGKEMPSLKSKKHLCFLPTDINSKSKEELVLKNNGPSCSISAYVEGECSVFQLCEDVSQKSGFSWNLHKRETLNLPVVFRPTEKICYQTALVVTATSPDGCTATNKVMLHGYGGCSKLSLHECSVNGEAYQRPLKVLRFPKGFGEEKKVVFLNKGIRHAFVFVAQPSADVSFSATKFVVSPFSQKTLTVKCLSRNLNQNVLIFHGEELFRQAISKKLAVLKKPSLLHMFDATGPFRDEENVPTETVYPVRELSGLGDLFYKHVLHFDILLTSSDANSTDSVNSSLESTFSCD